jgi:hypothetical protein
MKIILNLQSFLTVHHPSYCQLFSLNLPVVVASLREGLAFKLNHPKSNPIYSLGPMKFVLYLSKFRYI